MSTLTAALRNTPLVDKDGYISRQWIQYLQSRDSASSTDDDANVLANLLTGVAPDLSAEVEDINARMELLYEGDRGAVLVQRPTLQRVPAGGINTVFHNTGETPTWVTVTAILTVVGGVQAVAQILCDGSNPPTTVVATATTSTVFSSGSTGVQASPLSFIVLPGNYYELVATGTVTIGSWIEWQ